MKTRWLDIILGQILLGFVLFAFDVDGSIVSSVFVSSQERTVERRLNEKQKADSDASFWSDRLSNLSALYELEDKAETFGSNGSSSRLKRGRSTFRTGRSSRSSCSRSIQPLLISRPLERFQERAAVFCNLLSSRSLTRPLFLVLLKLRN